MFPYFSGAAMFFIRQDIMLFWRGLGIKNRGVFASYVYLPQV